MLLVEKKDKIFKVKIESLDDLFVLKQVLSKEDIIYSKGQRKVKIDNKQITKTFNFEIKVKKIELTDSSLKVLGTILNENEFVAIGQHQSSYFEVFSIIEFKKENFLDFEKNLFEKSLSSKKNSNLLILFDKDDLICFEFFEFSYKFLFEENGLGSKKNHYEIDEYLEKYKLVENYVSKDYSNVFLASSKYNTQKFKKIILEKNKINIVELDYIQVSKEQIKNILKLISQNNLIKENEITRQVKVVEEFLKQLNKEKNICYGEENVFNSLEDMRCKTLIFTTKFLEKIREEDKYFEFENLIKSFEIQNDTSIHLINSVSQSGEIIDGFSGIVSILRY